METKVYVDVLLVINYVVNLLLMECTARLTGRRPARKRMVLAALTGAVGALTIFLPVSGFVVPLLIRLGLAAVIVAITFGWHGRRAFAGELFVFFAVSMFFSGVMLAVQILFAPQGMLYANGIVYFELSSITLVLTTAAAYAALSVLHRIWGRGQLRETVYLVEVVLNGKTVQLDALLDTGNRLYEPFSGAPVMVCGLDAISPLFSPAQIADLCARRYLDPDWHGETAFRLVPYRAVSGQGMLPAFCPDRLLVCRDGEWVKVERVYIAVCAEPIGGEAYTAILHPEMTGVQI